MRNVGEKALELTKEITVAIANNCSFQISKQGATEFADFLGIIYEKAKQIVIDADTQGYST